MSYRLYEVDVRTTTDEPFRMNPVAGGAFGVDFSQLHVAAHSPEEAYGLVVHGINNYFKLDGFSPLEGQAFLAQLEQISPIRTKVREVVLFPPQRVTNLEVIIEQKIKAKPAK